MVNYYNTLRVSPKASRAEIKSAYRRLARKLHPDVNNGSEETALKFAEIAEAYEILGNSRERAAYDKRLLHATLSESSNGNSVFESTNPHARRWRQMVIEKRYNEIIDRMIEEERRETNAFQRIVFPIVALLVSVFLAAATGPSIFERTGVLGKVLILTLAAVGTLHLIGRLKDGLERYTFDETLLHESIFDDNEPKPRPYTRAAATAFVAVSITLSFVLGYLAEPYLVFVSVALPSLFVSGLTWEFALYPPIVVLLVDIMHSVVSRFD